jgi:hypothetical protein
MRDPGIDTESAKEVLEGGEKVNQCVVAGTYVIDRLGKSDVKEMCGSEGRKRDTRRVRCRSQRILLLQARMAVKAVRKRYTGERFPTYHKADCFVKGRANRRRAQDVN